MACASSVSVQVRQFRPAETKAKLCMKVCLSYLELLSAKTHWLRSFFSLWLVSFSISFLVVQMLVWATSTSVPQMSHKIMWVKTWITRLWSLAVTLLDRPWTKPDAVAISDNLWPLKHFFQMVLCFPCFTEGYGIFISFLKREIMRYSDINKPGYIGELLMVRWWSYLLN